MYVTYFIVYEANPAFGDNFGFKINFGSLLCKKNELNEHKCVRFVCVADVHFTYWEKEDPRKFPLILPQGDILLIAGDLTRRGRPDEIDKFIRWFETIGGYYKKIIIPGNHDYCLDPNMKDHYSKESEEKLKRLKDTIYLVDESFDLEIPEKTISKIKIYGTPISQARHVLGFIPPTQKGINSIIEKIPTDTDILLVHGPPFGILDKVFLRGNLFVGEKKLREVVLERVKPRYCIFGHIHECYGYKKIDNTIFINASIKSLLYRVRKKGAIVFDYVLN